MNEGCATFVHHYIMHELHNRGLIGDGAILEFIHSHTSVVFQPEFDDQRYSGINPYALGFAMMEDIKRGGKFSECHFIEFMGCPGGCLGGGGQPIPTSPEIRAKRAKAIYAEDAAYEIRKSHENPAVAEIYNKFLTDGPCGKLSHKLLHTRYVARGKYIA